MSAISSPAKANPISNPLLIGDGLPPFGEITAEYVVPGIEQLLKELSQALAELEETLADKLQSITPITWEDTVTPLTAITERLSWSWGIVGHLMGVKNSAELRAAYESVQPQLVQFSTRLGQSQTLYQALNQLRSDGDWSHLAPAQQRIVESAMREAELSGVGLGA